MFLVRNVYVVRYHTCRSARSGKGKPDDRNRRTDGYGVGATTERPVTGNRGQRADGEPKQPTTVPRTVRRPSSEERESGPSELGGSRNGRKDWGTHNRSESVQRTAARPSSGSRESGARELDGSRTGREDRGKHQPNRSGPVPTAGQGQVAGHAGAGSAKSAAAEMAVRSVDNTQTEALRNRSRNGERPSSGPRESGGREIGSPEPRKVVRPGENTNRTGPNPIAERWKTEYRGHARAGPAKSTLRGRERS